MTNPDRNFLTAGQEAVIRHWSLCGQRGRTSLKRATTFDWKSSQFIAPKVARWYVPLQAHHVPLLLLGFVPTLAGDDQMIITENFVVGDKIRTHGMMSSSADPNVKASEDKWFVYATGPDFNGHVSIDMVCCWTSTKVLELTIELGRAGILSGLVEGTPHISHIAWESDPRVWQVNEEHKAKEVAQEVCRWVLNVDFEEQTGFVHPETSQFALEDAMRVIPPMGPTTVYSQR